VPSVDEIAQFIRAADGAHQMGEGALAERLHAWLAPQPANPASAPVSGTAQGADPPPNLSEYDLGQWWVKEIERRRAEKEAAPTQYGWLSMESVASHIAEQVVSKIAALTPQAVQGAEPSDIAAVRHTLMTGLAHNAAIAALNRIAPAGLGKVVPA
jgi:hypothetical protein